MNFYKISDGILFGLLALIRKKKLKILSKSHKDKFTIVFFETIVSLFDKDKFTQILTIVSLLDKDKFTQALIFKKLEGTCYNAASSYVT